MGQQTLYQRLGGYDGISGFANNLLPRLQQDELLSRFWHNRGADGVSREKQLLIDFLCNSTGGTLYYTGRDMKLTHQGMAIDEADWQAFLGHAGATMSALAIPSEEQQEIVGFVLGLKDDIVER